MALDQVVQRVLRLQQQVANLGTGGAGAFVDLSDAEFDALGETGGENEHTLTESEMPAHTHVQDSHNHTQDSHNHTVPVNTSDGSETMADRATTSGSATITSGGTTAPNQAATATNQDTGGDQPHNNLQPYLVLNWLIKT